MTKVLTALKLVLAVVMPLLVASGVFSLFYFPTRLLTDACAGEGACAAACMLCYVPVGLGGLVGGLLGLTTLLAGLPTGIGWALHSTRLGQRLRETEAEPS